MTTVTLNYQGNIPSTGDTVTVTAGRAAKFTCTTSFSRPQATIDWYIKVDHNIHAALKQSSTSPTYHLMATDADHNKRIYCKTYNNVAVAQGIVSEKPMLYVQGRKTGI